MEHPPRQALPSGDGEESMDRLSRACQAGKWTFRLLLDKLDRLSIMPAMDFWDRIDPLAEELGVSGEARRKWRKRETVPGGWHLLLLDKARKRGVELSDDELLSTTSRGRAA